jgi:hypothetical protein
VSISGIQSSGFDLAFAYKFKVYFGLFPKENESTGAVDLAKFFLLHFFAAFSELGIVCS